MLKVSNLNVSYGAVHAIHNVNLEVNEGEIVSLIGANGAGKTTILHTITGLKDATSGSITYNDTDLRKIDPSNCYTWHGSCSRRKTCFFSNDSRRKFKNGCIL